MQQTFSGKPAKTTSLSDQLSGRLLDEEVSQSRCSIATVSSHPSHALTGMEQAELFSIPGSHQEAEKVQGDKKHLDSLNKKPSASVNEDPSKQNSKASLVKAVKELSAITEIVRKTHNALPESLHRVINRRDTWLGRDNFETARTGRSTSSSEGNRKSSAANNDQHYHQSLATGFAALDTRLCEQGWPLGTCIEVLSDASGMGSMGLFLPAMEGLSKQGRWQAFIAPPYVPYAPLLAARGINTEQVLLVHPRDREEQLWSTEQALRSGTCSAVFSWLSSECRYAELRRLQLAAARGNSLAVLFRPQEAAHQHSPAALRLQMSAYRQVHILKQRSGIQGTEVYLPPEDDIPNQPQLWELPADVPPGKQETAGRNRAVS
ncbi:MAG: translesion DNA synthesis-associated protein ImuA [Pseudomonadota bacterium]